LARGFTLGWQPHWMGAALADVPRMPRPEGVELHVGAGGDRVDVAAHVAGRPVGGCYGLRHGRTLGIFDLEVEDAARGRGIGAAVTSALCAAATRSGATAAVLNATPDGERVYRRLGFASLGCGQTWWLHRPALRPPPPAAEVALAEAIGRNDVGALDQLRPSRARLAGPLASGLLPLALAAELGARRAAEWLVAHGAEIDVLAAWQLGWRKRAAEAVRRPGAVTRRHPPNGATLLHLAVERDDVELAELALAAGAPRDARDGVWQGTPLDWARALDRPRLATLLRP
jgi:GNAT superfamily N-acetyltransferase